MVEDQHLEGLQNDENFQWRDQSLLVPESQLQEPRQVWYQEPDATLYAQLNRRRQSECI